MTEAELFDRLACLAEQGRAARLGIMGGTFDPPHVGHVALARAAADQLGLDFVLFMPAGNPSFKRDKAVTPAMHRLAMLELALGAQTSYAVSSREIDREGITYTADTLEELKSLVPAVTQLVFIMGGDSLRTLPCWRRAHRILELCDVAVGPRQGEDATADLRALLEFDPDARVNIFDSSTVPTVSSTQLRDELSHGAEPLGMMSPSVLRYIYENKLYTC